jgi:SAM-dependent methyltransferase
MTSFYKAFEDVYRGPREEVASRLRQYLPFLQPLKAATGQPKAVDLGCGRGEWLELLDSLGFEYEGIDVDQDMLETCRAIGLNARKEDAHDYLELQPDESLDLVTAFHVIEHMTFDQMSAVIANAFRVLRPGGLLILETPNPENLVVATLSFYLDPTHIRPVPPLLLQFYVEYSGFSKTVLARLQENPDLHDAQTVTLLDALGGVSPDYSIIALKPGGANQSEGLESAFSRKFGLRLSDLAARFEGRLQIIDERSRIAASRAGKLSQDLEGYQEAMSSLEAKVVELSSLMKDVKNFVTRLNRRVVSLESSSLMKDIQNSITEFNTKVMSFETRMEYASRRTIVEKLFFRLDGRPVRLLRKFLFHTSGKPRRLARVLVLHKNGMPRRAFSYWMKSKEYLELRKAVKGSEHQPEVPSVLKGSFPVGEGPVDDVTPRERYFIARLRGQFECKR